MNVVLMVVNWLHIVLVVESVVQSMMIKVHGAVVSLEELRDENVLLWLV